ncbi:hypothetical protein [Methylomonas koyamae]|uniref:hypothetical protein n=1 Tax=Methylomonas koyamae TaxID=702114 RepID=UPI000A95B461|nr:hypothetical protein [Methylomonas koyamae]
MSKQANPLAIGTFLVGALTLLVVALMVFGGGQFFKEKNRFVIFFDSALNGLNVARRSNCRGCRSAMSTKFR